MSRNHHQILNNDGSSVKFEIEELIQEVLLQDQQYVKLEEKFEKTKAVGYTKN